MRPRQGRSFTLSHIDAECGSSKQKLAVVCSNHASCTNIAQTITRKGLIQNTPVVSELIVNFEYHSHGCFLQTILQTDLIISAVLKSV